MFTFFVTILGYIVYHYVSERQLLQCYICLIAVVFELFVLCPEMQKYLIKPEKLPNSI